MSSLSRLEAGLDELLERLRPILAVVHDGRRGAGAGLLLGAGLVLTNSHVAGRARTLQVELQDGTSYAARLLKRDPDVDLALLELPVRDLPAAVLSDRLPRPGEIVFAFGHPWGQRNVLTGGVLSALVTARSRSGEFQVLRTDAQLAPGNSGGPLLNAAGEVIGLNAMIVGGDQSVAIPVAVIRKFLEAAGVSVQDRASREAVH